jgi:hypothetical protein
MLQVNLATRSVVTHFIDGIPGTLSNEFLEARTVLGIDENVPNPTTLHAEALLPNGTVRRSSIA